MLLLLSAAEHAASHEWQWPTEAPHIFGGASVGQEIPMHAPAQTDFRSVARLADPELLAAAVG